MDLTIPFSKEIPFKSTIAEIVSISLEHDVSINDDELLGDFILEGEYKNLDINVDTNPFNHVIPFNVSLSKDIDINTLNYEIVDFKYEIINEDTLKVDIKFHVTADKLMNRIDELFQKTDEELIIEESNDDIKEEIIEETKREDNNEISSNILNNDLKEDFITYHIHMVKINETIDTICKEYKIDKETLLSINDIENNISIGDKLIIPELDEE